MFWVQKDELVQKLGRYLEKQWQKNKTADRSAESNNILIQSLKDNAKKPKHATKYKQLDKYLDQSDSCRRSVLTPTTIARIEHGSVQAIMIAAVTSIVPKISSLWKSPGSAVHYFVRLGRSGRLCGNQALDDWDGWGDSKLPQKALFLSKSYPSLWVPKCRHLFPRLNSALSMEEGQKYPCLFNKIP